MKHRLILLSAEVLLLLCGLPLFAQELPRSSSAYVSLEHRMPDAMILEDRKAWQSRKADIARSAAIHGYQLDSSWTVDQAVCPLFPDTVLLHYRRSFDDGSVSLFSAVVPRQGGRVEVIEALHRNGTGFFPSARSKRTAALFQSLVPKELAAQAVTSKGDWLSLGLCYAELAGMQPLVPRRPADEIATVRAPQPTLFVDGRNQDRDDRREIVFADHEIPNLYTDWTITLDSKGRVIGGRADDRSAAIGMTPPEGTPHGQTLPEMSLPAGKPVPEGEPGTAVHVQ